MNTKPNLIKFLQVIFICISVVSLSFLLSGCDDIHKLMESGSQKIRVIVLIDETDSFGSVEDNVQSTGGRDTTIYWDEVKPLIIKIIKKLGPGDQFELIGIDEKGFQDADVRIKFKTITETFLMIEPEQNSIIKIVEELNRRKDVHSGTDILGALKYAASQDSGYQTRIFCFSDMKQYPALNQQEATGLKFSQATKVYFIVPIINKEDDESDSEAEWLKIVSIWKPIIEGAGLKFIYVGPTANFIKYGDIEIRLTEILKNWN